MKILLHACCGPCTTFPLTTLREAGHSVEGFFLNPNIHPFKEFKRRLTAFDSLCSAMNFRAEIVREYGLKDFLRRVVFHEKERCSICYKMRLEIVACRAKENGADAFTTTLLYSRYQKHELIKKVGEECGQLHNIPFYYEDFRVGWQKGIDMAIDMEFYRQPYCGCIYSEQERYDKNCKPPK